MSFSCSLNSSYCGEGFNLFHLPSSCKVNGKEAHQNGRAVSRTYYMQQVMMQCREDCRGCVGQHPSTGLKHSFPHLLGVLAANPSEYIALC